MDEKNVQEVSPKGAMAINDELHYELGYKKNGLQAMCIYGHHDGTLTRKDCKSTWYRSLSVSIVRRTQSMVLWSSRYVSFSCRRWTCCHKTERRVIRKCVHQLICR